MHLLTFFVLDEKSKMSRSSRCLKEVISQFSKWAEDVMPSLIFSIVVIIGLLK
jgi:hypothetical protein